VSRRYLFLFALVGLLTLTLGVKQARADWPEPDEDKTPLGDEGTLCVPGLVWRDRHACPQYGPATTAARVASIQLPDPLPELAVVPLVPPAEGENSVVPFTYAQVIQDNVPVYKHPIEAAYGLPPQRWLGVGFIWVSVQGRTTYEGQDYYQINKDEYVRTDALGMYAPSTFQGVALAEQPEHPFAWVLKAVHPQLTPQGDYNADAPVYYRYQLVQIFATEYRGDEVWYLIGPDQWIEQVYVGKVDPSPPPPGVEAGAAWVDINIFEQTLAAYVGERMVYATLVSSGLPGWDTPPGLFQVWRKVEKGKMSGAHNKPDYYFLEDVPWSLYFNQDVAMHAAYWHNSFGYRHSHGCVNLAPADARWLFGWAPEALWVQVQPGQELAAN
jgi:lipoprotein-anchoring transpeptidase ErfK/SrfK